MHELGIIEYIFTVIEQVADENQLTTINSVTLKIGKLRQVVPDMMTFAFESVAKGTRADGAVLQLEQIPIRMKCHDCGTEFEVDDQSYVCPECDGVKLETLTGKEVVLEALNGH